MSEPYRKSELESMQQTIKFFETLLRASNDGIVITDATQNIVVVNEAFCDFFGRRWRDVVETNLFVWLDQLDAGARMRWAELGQRVYLEGDCRAVEFQIPWEGRVRHLSVNASLLERVADEETGVIISTWRDITERKRAEEQIRRYAADLEQRNEEIKQFAYIVSHDLRAPLVNVQGFAAELGDALQVIGSAMDATLPHLEEEQRQAVSVALREDVPEALGFINSSATRMDGFINAVLKLSRLGRRELELEAVDMSALVQATLRTLAHQIQERQVKASVGTLPTVIADQTSMEQIMGNLLTNAVAYLAPGRPGEIEISAEHGRDETTFQVRDNGRGIAQGDMHKVFAPFRRAGKRDVPGEGMGLPYVQALVRRHGGKIWCESELDKGTMFSFTIPKHPGNGVDHV